MAETAGDEVTEVIVDQDDDEAALVRSIHNLIFSGSTYGMYWHGGKTIPENARLTHRYCNRAGGGRD